ncbi:UNVERIFIED_ORG: hypothetical protein J2W65_002869 [Pseudomonas parafulva]|nr:hypothetical protein [Pseudomonas parafulva]
MPVTSLRKTCVRPSEVAKIKSKSKSKSKSKIGMGVLILNLKFRCAQWLLPRN